jgi:hypothetical protein
MILTIAVPVAHESDANHYAMVLGYSASEAKTYSLANWEDTIGNLYAVASLGISDTFIGTATSALVRPAWDTQNTINMTAAARAQAMVSLWLVGSDAAPTQAAPDRITAIGGMEGLDALAAMGLALFPRDI